MLFSDLNIGRSLLNALDDLGLEQPTPIQAKTFAPIMSGKDIVGIAQTGTGKTFAYLLPTLRMWTFTKSPQPQILIVVPTRELVMQVVEEAQKLVTYMNVEVVGVYGGTNIRRQKAEVEIGVDVLVGTPGRLIDLLKDGVLKTRKLRHLVLDEVDEMLDLGFKTQLEELIFFMPKKRQHLMFSATMTPEVENVIQGFTELYNKIEAAPSGAPLENIEQYAYKIPNFNSKANLLELLLRQNDDFQKVLVFVKTKKLADFLYERLLPVFGESLDIIHSSKSQNYRFRAVDKFDQGTVRCLIATDIIARGLDVEQVTHVVNFDLPETPEKYIHRIGRTGRAEERGIALAFITDDDQDFQLEIEVLMEKELNFKPLPDGLELSDELIHLEKGSPFQPYNPHKQKQHKPSGPAFHEKAAHNLKGKDKKER
jgi:ATP-dependent RNA helicase RhlE